MLVAGTSQMTPQCRWLFEDFENSLPAQCRDALSLLRNSEWMEFIDPKYRKLAEQCRTWWYICQGDRACLPQP
jgi:hypothetical protein